MALMYNNPEKLIVSLGHHTFELLESVNVHITRELLTEIEYTACSATTAQQGSVASYSCTAVNLPQHQLIHGSLARVCLYLGCWAENCSYSNLNNHLEKISGFPIPWGSAVVAHAFPKVSAPKRGVRDFDVGNITGGHPSGIHEAAAAAPLKLDGLEHFSTEIAILRSLLPLYLENT